MSFISDDDGPFSSSGGLTNKADETLEFSHSENSLKANNCSAIILKRVEQLDESLHNHLREIKDMVYCGLLVIVGILI